MINLNNLKKKNLFNHAYNVRADGDHTLGYLQTSVLIWNSRDELVYLSPLAKKTLRDDYKRLLYSDWTQLFPADVVFDIKRHFEQTTEQLLLENVTIGRNDKNECMLDLTIDQIHINGDEHYICLLQDYSYIKELEYLLQDMERITLAGQLSAGLVHEIRNPLTSLKGFLQLVQAGVKQKEQYYQVMIHEIEKLEHITAELLQLGKPLKRTKQRENIADLIRDCIFLFQVQADFRDIEFQLDMMENVFFHCNALQMKQIFMNIIKNGAEAMQKRGTISISLQKKQETIEIHITDEGKGIAPQDVGHLHEPFFSTKDDGTGLGLLVTNHLVEIHGGKLSVQSTENIGTTFSIILPSEKENDV